MTGEKRAENRIRVAGYFLLGGLALEAASLLRVAAFSFVIYTAFAIPLFLIGELTFLLALLVLPGLGAEKEERKS